MESNTRTEYQYWQKKQTGEVFAIKLRGETPRRLCGPLNDRQYKARDGRLLQLKLEVFHCGYSFVDDTFNYLICDA